MVWDHGVAGSNPVLPTGIFTKLASVAGFLFSVGVCSKLCNDSWDGTQRMAYDLGLVPKFSKNLLWAMDMASDKHERLS